MLHQYLPPELDALQSRGSTAKKAGSLAGLHEKRKETLSQFFTPAWLAAYLWKTLSPAFNEEGRYSLLDNSVGAASMFRFADPERFCFFGIDADAELVSQVGKILDENHYKADIIHAPMENVELDKFSVGLLNPPFSIPLSSPFLKACPGITHYGKHGPDTSALSHEYALAQALAHCDIVAAVVPASTKDVIAQNNALQGRLRAIFELPSDTFKEENVASVKTDLLIFGPKLLPPQANAPESIRIKRGAINENSEPQQLFQLSCRTNRDLGGRLNDRIKIYGVESSKPVITTPITGIKDVVLNRAGRWIKLSFSDGAVEGRVKNALYRERLFSSHEHKYPARTRYSGQFQLNLDVISLQSDPFLALSTVCQTIRRAGGNLIVTMQLIAGIRSIITENRKMSVPFGRTVYRKGTPVFKAVANRMALINRTEKGAAVRADEEVSAKRVDNGFMVTTGRGQFSCDHDQFFSLFTPENSAMEAGFWEEIFPPIEATFSEDIARLREKAERLGIDQWLNWDYQYEDLCELAFKPKGAICGWQMALGKSRLAAALALLLNGKSLLVLKSRLVMELEAELKTLGLTDYRVIQNLADIENLGKINIISYERLKRPLNPKYPKLTLARFLRKKIKNVLCDEGGLLANQYSQQTRAVWQLGERRSFILDGTPVPNYVRDMLPLASWTFGQERAYQPYSLSGGYIEPRLFTSAAHQPTGRDEFNSKFVTIEWATNEFLDSGVGAKREIPKIKPASLGDYRQWIAPMLKRRVQQEPAVSKYVKFPIPELREPIQVEWDLSHLALYVKVAEEFSHWYKGYAKERGEEGKSLNLTMILARLEACFKAANVPSAVSGYGKGFNDLTTKEIACLELIEKEIEAGRRPIVFARNPVVLHRLSAELNKRNITNLVFTGEETINKRIEKLNSRIRNGQDQVLLASMGVTQDGLNLPMLNTVIFYCRSWKSREEFQAIYRLIRPQQKSDVICYFLHLAGSIDEYQAQLIMWKSLACEAGLDYGEQSNDDDFVHFDAFIYRFINSIPHLKEKIRELKMVA